MTDSNQTGVSVETDDSISIDNDGNVVNATPDVPNDDADKGTEPTVEPDRNAERANNVYEVVKDQKKLDALSNIAVETLTPIATKLRGNAIIRSYDESWRKMSNEDKKATLSEPGFFKKYFGGPFYVKHQFDRYFIGGLLLMGAIGGENDDQLIQEVYSAGFAEKAVQAILNIGQFIEPELAPLAKAVNVAEALRSQGLKISKAVRSKAMVPGNQEQTHETAADTTGDNVVPHHQAPQPQGGQTQ